MELEGKVALITGGSRGIGDAIGSDLIKNGAEIAICDLRPIEETAGRKIPFFSADVSNFKRAEEVVSEVVRTLGRLDILINNAGINADHVIWKMTEEEWDRVIAVNLKGAFNYSRAAAPIFRDQGSGKIVNISSVNALRGHGVWQTMRRRRPGLSGSLKRWPGSWENTT